MRRRIACCLSFAIVASLPGVMSARGAVRSQNQSVAQDRAPAGERQKATPKKSTPTPTSGTPNAPSGSHAKTQTKSPSSPQAAPQSDAFPLAQSEAAAQSAREKDEKQTTGGIPAPPPAPYTGPYSSSGAGMSPDALGEGASPPGRKPSRGMDTFTRDHTLDGRIADDLNAADLYIKNGNYRGALWRYQDALHYDPENDTAMYGVADAMCKQKREDDAMAHFKTYLKRHPAGKHAKKAETMLAHPERCGGKR